MPDKPSNITRRQAIIGTASVLGASAAASSISALLVRAAEAAADNKPAEFFAADEFALLTSVADTLIPDTATPGAVAVGVPHFVDLMFVEWASAERKQRYREGLAGLADDLQAAGAPDFASADAGLQLQALSTVDQRAFTEDAYGNFYRELKKLLMFAYYTTETGATEELQYEALTPNYIACGPIDDIGRTWFWLGYSHGL